MESNAVPNEHEFVRPDEPTKITNNSKSPLSNLTTAFRYIPEDSCDSVVSIDDVDDDEDEDDVADAPGKSLNKIFQGPSPARSVKSQEPSAVEELQALMLSVGETSGGGKENLEKVQDGQKTCKVESSMEVDVQKDKSSVSVPNLEMVEEPEESYRARYESEGCRGPIRGISENGFPTVRVNGYSGSVLMTVFLVTECGEPHLHSITGPGSTKTLCKEVTLEGNISAIQTVIGPEQNMTAVWDSLSVRRIRNWDADKKLRERGDNPAAWKTKKKEARLMFQCNIPQTSERPGYILTCQSRPFMCTAPSGNPEIWWISEKESFPKGGKEIGIIGKKFSTGFRVRFYGTDSEGLWEANAEVDKSKSHQSAIVLKVPPYKNADIDKKIEVLIEVRVGPEKDKRCSESIAFVYKPEESVEVQGQGPCSYCNSVKNALSHLFGKESKTVQDSDRDSVTAERQSPHIDELVAQKERLDSSQRGSTDRSSFPDNANFDGDVQMSDLTKKPTEQLKKNTEKRTDVTSVGPTPFTSTITASAPSTTLSSSHLQANNNSPLLKLILQNQVVTANASVLQPGFTSTASNPVALVSALPGLPVSVSVPSQPTVPVQVYTSSSLNTNQLIRATETKSHAATVSLNPTANVTILPSNLAKTSQPPVQLVFNSQAALQHGHTLSSAGVFSPGFPAQNTSVQLSNSSVTTNGNTAVTLGSMTGQKYFILDGLPQVTVKEEKSQKECSMNHSANGNSQLGISSVGSVGSLPTGLPYQAPEFVKTSSPLSTMLLVSQGQGTSVPQYITVTKPDVEGMIGIYPPIQGLQQPTLNQPQQQIPQPQQKMQQPEQQMKQQQVFHHQQQHQQHFHQPQQQMEQQKELHVQNPLSIASVSSSFIGNIDHSVTQLPSTVHVTPLSDFRSSQAVIVPQNLVTHSMQAQSSSNTCDVTLNMLQPSASTERTYTSESSHGYIVQHSTQQPVNELGHCAFPNHPISQRSGDFPVANNHQEAFNSILSNSVAPVTSTAAASCQEPVSSFEGVGITSSLPFDSSASFVFSTSNVMPNETELPSSTNYADTREVEEKQKNANEPGKLGDNVLAHDLNRLSVVSSYMQQSPQVFSKPRDIPVNARGFPDEFNNQAPSMGDPQPMSLTDDTLPAELSELIKESARPNISGIQFDNSQSGIIGTMGEETGYSNNATVDEQSHNFSSGLQQQQLPQQQRLEKQQQHHLADSFLVPQLQESHLVHETTDAVNAFIVGEDLMIGGSTYTPIDNEPKISTTWAQTGHSVNNDNSSTEIKSSNWTQQTNANQGQTIVNNVTAVASVNGNSGFATDYSGQQSNSSAYGESGRDDFQSDGSSSRRETISPQQQFTVQRPDMPSDEQGKQQGGNIMPQISSGTFSHAHSHTTVGLENHVAQQQQQQQQQQTFFNDQSFSNTIVPSISDGQQCYNNAINNSAKVGTIYTTENAGSLPGQIGLQDVLHQTSMNVNHQSMTHQNMNESVSSHSSSHGIMTTAGTTDQSDFSTLKQGLIEDLKAFLTKGFLNQQEVQELYQYINRDEHWLLEVYSSSKHSGEGLPELVERLKHWVKHAS